MSTENKDKLRKEALEYHASGRPGKLEVIPSKAYSTQRDLSLAYSPGVAEPCLEIAEKPETVYQYTAKGNLVAVISNGTAVLGLGNIGPEASKPVMEGKGLLFKIFADIDVFDIEVAENDVEKFIQVVKAISPTFGGINLEDIKAPECFEIERRLKAELNIPIMHDDQHGTAIITGAALLNALEIADKKIEQVKIVVNGAGASAISCAKLFISLGVSKDNLVMLDSKGVLNSDRDDDLDETKVQFIRPIKIKTLEEAMKGADVFLGLSKGNILSPEMIQSMANRPIVFALANPTPEISYPDALSAREEVIMATGRSDYPNQVNNVLGFPFIFRGALDVRATCINEEMKLAAVRAIAELAKKQVPDIVNLAYNQSNITFGKDYIIPKPLDPRLITTVAPAVAKAAMDSGVAKHPILNWNDYEDQLLSRLGKDNQLMKMMVSKAKQCPMKIVFAEGDSERVIKAAIQVRDENIARPILLGDEKVINGIFEHLQIDSAGIEIVNPRTEGTMSQDFLNFFVEKTWKKGYNLNESRRLLLQRNYYAAMMVELGMADAMISGATQNYKDTLKPALDIIGTYPGVSKVAGMYWLNTKKGPIFLADTTINKNPNIQDLLEIAKMTAYSVKQFNIEPRLAFLSYSNFGSNLDENTRKMKKTVQILNELHPELVVEGEIQANFAVNPQLLKENFPLSKLVEKGANVLIFPDLNSGNICYKLLQELGGAEAIGPILMGMNKPVHVLQLGSSVREIVDMVIIACVDAQRRQKLEEKV